MTFINPVKKKSLSKTLAAIPAPKSQPFDLNNVFIVKTANTWIQESKTQPIPRMLFGELWFENEWCILFSDAGVGKSILAVQIAEAISSGNKHELFPVEVEPQPVLYFDYELSAKQFEKRYSKDYKEHFIFNDNFYRVSINKNTDDVSSFQEHIYSAIEAAIIRYKAKVVIIDNITYLSMISTDSAKDSLPLINQLLRLKNRFGISLLTLHHTPKRDKSQPITENDLAGSKMFSNFCDALMTIGVSAKDNMTKYIKQIKIRSGAHLYGSENVIVANVERVHNYLQFSFTGFGSEREFLKELSEREKKDIDDVILDMMKTDDSLSLRKAVEKLKEKGVNTNHTYVRRLCAKNNIPRK
jgi:predicted ATP-dependent serine protease